VGCLEAAKDRYCCYQNVSCSHYFCCYSWAQEEGRRRGHSYLALVVPDQISRAAFTPLTFQNRMNLLSRSLRMEMKIFEVELGCSSSSCLLEALVVVATRLHLHLRRRILVDRHHHRPSPHHLHPHLLHPRPH
jgi:hypothetical protein